MSDNPLDPGPEHEARVRERAYHLWDADGRPYGRDLDYWLRAEELVAMEEHPAAGLQPNPMTRHEPMPGVTIEEAEIQENYGEFPDRFTDQGDWRPTPMTKKEERKWQKGKKQPTHGDTP